MATSLSNHLVVLTHASRALAEAKTLDQLSQIRNKAEAARQYARTAKLGLEIQNYAAELKLRAERKAGLLLAQLALAGGDRKSKSHDERLKLSDLGIGHNQSARWQAEASVPEDIFEQYLAAATGASKELTTQGLLKIAKRFRATQENQGTLAKRSRCGSSTRSTDLLRGRCSDFQVVPVSRHSETIVELKDHLHLLAQILKGSFIKGNFIEREIEVATVHRLMREVISLVDELT